MEFFGGTSSQVAETHVSEESLALIGNTSGQDAEGAINCSEAFSIGGLKEGARSGGCCYGSVGKTRHR
jgi:hypothetical protein